MDCSQKRGKIDNGHRLQSNKATYQDAYPLPMIDDILDQLGKEKFFSALDLCAGFHQIPMKEESKKYTAFSTQLGHFEYNRMPFGLKNAPATFQRMMDRAFHGLIGGHCFVYIDDIVIFGNTIQEHYNNLGLVLQRITDLGLKLESTKCEYLKPELEYLGHIITKNGEGHLCLFISRTLNKAEKTYTTSEKELLAIVWAVKRLRPYLLGKKFTIQTDHKALIWLHNVKDPSSRFLRSRLRLEEHVYEIEYVKGKENKVADCLSRLFPIQEKDVGQIFAVTKDSLRGAMESAGISNEKVEEENLEELLPEIEIFDTPVIREDRILQEKEKIKLPQKRMREPSPETDIGGEREPKRQSDSENLYTDFMQWRLNPIPGKIKIKPNAIGKLWTTLKKEDLPKFIEEQWLRKLGQLIEEILSKNLTIIRICIGDPLISPMEKESLQEMLEFLSTYYRENSFSLCFVNTRELSKEEQEAIVKEAHATHMGEQNTLEKAQKLGHWTNMENDI
ncbi:uncharacterized protein LOC117170832 [Belonocnema kinseyi]|uniref:uncharacterized protein LOC117170832 n=1 Tax=Belonocnema kinseyi TaxID=2817044 RepID=UPI00143DD556|nr:uncharacterized protein LOC117170832 [Belonocnema kinseyi]